MARKSVELVRDIAFETVRERVPGLSPHYSAELVNDSDAIDDVRRFSANEYIRYGKIEESDLDRNGLPIDDELHSASNYFACYDNEGEIMATDRIIWTPDSKVSDLRMPVDLLPEQSRDFLNSLNSGEVAEFGSLSKAKGVSTIATLKVLRENFLFARDNNIRYMICGLEPSIYPHFKKMFGASLHELSPGVNIEYPDFKGEQIPLIMEPMKAYAQQKEQMRGRNMGQKAIATLARNFFGKEDFYRSINPDESDLSSVLEKR